MSYQNEFGDYLSVKNFNKLYCNVRDIIQSSNSFNIDQDDKYKKIFKRLMISIHKKNDTEKDVLKLNTITVNKCIPFLINLIQKKTQKNETILPYDYYNNSDTLNDSFQSALNTSDNSDNKICETNEDFMKRFAEMEKERNLQIETERKRVPQESPSQFQSNQPELKMNTQEIKTNTQEIKTNTQEIKTQFQQVPLKSQKSENAINSEEPQKQEDSNKNNMLNNFFEPIQSTILTIPTTNQTKQMNQMNQEIKSNTIYDKSIIIDTGTSDNPYVNNIGNKYWSKFSCALDEYYIINEKTNVFLESITIQGVTDPQNTSNIYIQIDEIEIDNMTNNKQLNRVINIPNTSQQGTLTMNCHKYIGSIKDKTVEQLTFTIMNQDMKTIDENNHFVFKDSSMKNRIIIELGFIISI